MQKIKRILTGPVGILLGALVVAFVGFMVIRALSGKTPINVMGSIRERGTIKIGVRNDLAPLGYIDSDGKLAGFEAELAIMLGEEILGGPGVELVEVTPKTRGAMLDQSYCDILVASVNKNETNVENYNMGEVYYQDQVMFLCESNAEIDLTSSDTTVGAISGSASKSILEAYFEENKGLKAQLKVVASYPEARRDLTQFNIDFYCSERSILSSMLRDGYKITGPVIGSLQYAPTCRLREKDLAAEIERAYGVIKTTDEFKQLYEKYDLTPPS